MIDKKEIKSVVNVLKSGIYAHGPISNMFESKFCNFTGAKYSTTVSSCLLACTYFVLHLGLELVMK